MKKSYKPLKHPIAKSSPKPMMRSMAPSMTGIQMAVEHKKAKEKMEEMEEAMMTAQAISMSTQKR